MKKIIAAAAFVLTVGFVQAQTDSSQSATNQTTTTTTTTQSTDQANSQGTRYDYYPDANVYYNDAAKTYSYYDSTTNKWESAAQLPSSYSVTENSKKSTVYYNGTNVWDKNADHVKQYGKKGKSTTPNQ